MKCLNLTDIDFQLAKNQFDHLIRVDHLYLGSKIFSSDQIDFVKSLGVNRVIDLKSSEETPFLDKQEFENTGIEYFNLPIQDLETLSFDELQEFGKLINHKSGKVLVYCMSGNRVGALLALNACIVCGHPKKRSLEFGERIGMKNPNTKQIISELLEIGHLP